MCSNEYTMFSVMYTRGSEQDVNVHQVISLKQCKNSVIYMYNHYPALYPLYPSTCQTVSLPAASVDLLLQFLVVCSDDPHL